MLLSLPAPPPFFFFKIKRKYLYLQECERLCHLCRQEQRLRYLKQQEQRHQQQASEQEKLQRLRDNIENQEGRLKKVRALKGQVEQKRVSNGKLGKLSKVSSNVYINAPCWTWISKHNWLLFPHDSFCVCSGGDRADEQPLPAEAERAGDGRVQGGGAEPTAGLAQKRQSG